MVASKTSVIEELQRLEREYRRLAQNPFLRRPQASGWSLFLIGRQKPPFKPGDDVWTQMEERTKSFVEEMSGRG